MRVLLAYRCPDGEADESAYQTLPPGLPWLAASVQAAGHEVTVANFSRLGWKDLERYLADARADVLGLSCLTAGRRTVGRLLRLARRTNPVVLTVAGGPHASALPMEMLERLPELDVVVRGEGERALVELLDRVGTGLTAGDAARDIAGLMVRGALPSAAWTIAPDPDSLPRPIAGLVAAGVLPERDLRHVVASRARAHGPALRRSRSLVAELRELRDRFGVVDVTLTGPGLIAERSFLFGLSAALDESRLRLSWDVSAELRELEPTPGPDEARLLDALRSARRSGCHAVRLTLDEQEDLGSARADTLRDRLSVVSRLLARAAMPAHLTVRQGSLHAARNSLQVLRTCVRSLRPRAGQVEARLVLPGSPEAEALSQAEGFRPDWWFEDERDVIPTAEPPQSEVVLPALAMTLRDAAKEARWGPRDLASAASVLGECEALHLEWARYRAHAGDLAEAERHLLRAVELEPESPLPWLELAQLLARDDGGGARERESAALSEVLARVPRHALSRVRLDSIRPARRGRRVGPARPVRGA